jgi:hypothetical protein
MLATLMVVNKEAQTIEESFMKMRHLVEMFLRA